MIEEISEEEWKEVGSPEYLCYLNMYWQDLLDTQSIKGFAYQIDGLGPRECVLVDGFGDIHAIPVRSLGGWANRMGLDDSCRRLAKNTGLIWDGKERQFQ